MRAFGENAVSLRDSINMRGVHTMMPPDIMFLLQQQRRWEMLQQAKQARLLQAVNGRPYCDVIVI